MRNSIKDTIAGAVMVATLAGCSHELEPTGRRTGEEILIRYVMENSDGKNSTFFGWDLDADLRTVDEGFILPGIWARDSAWFDYIDSGEINATHVISRNYGKSLLYKTTDPKNTRAMSVEEEKLFNSAYRPDVSD